MMLSWEMVNHRNRNADSCGLVIIIIDALRPTLTQRIRRVPIYERYNNILQVHILGGRATLDHPLLAMYQLSCLLFFLYNTYPLLGWTTISLRFMNSLVK